MHICLLLDTISTVSFLHLHLNLFLTCCCVASFSGLVACYCATGKSITTQAPIV